MIINLGLDMNLEFSWTEFGTAYSGEGQNVRDPRGAWDHLLSSNGNPSILDGINGRDT